MIFANQFWSHFNYCNLTHDTPDLVFEKCLSFQYEPGKLLPVQSQQLEKNLKYVHSYDKDTRLMPLTSS